MRMDISSEGLYLGALISGILSVIGFVAYLVFPPSLWTLMGFMGFGGVFLLVALILFYVGVRINGRLDVMSLF